MEIKKIDNIPIDDLVLRETESKYEQTRKRITRQRNNCNMSDKEIIECLAEEIEQDRKRIRKQEEYIKELTNETILIVKGNEEELKETEQVDGDIEETETVNIFANGKLITTTTKYKYKEKRKEIE